jgi:hypothetical protein
LVRFFASSKEMNNQPIMQCEKSLQCFSALEDYLKLIDLVGRKRADEIFEVMKTLTTAQNIRLEKLEILPSLPVSENT